MTQAPPGIRVRTTAVRRIGRPSASTQKAPAPQARQRTGTARVTSLQCEHQLELQGVTLRGASAKREPGSGLASSLATTCRQGFARITSKSTHANFTPFRPPGILQAPGCAGSSRTNHVARSPVAIPACAVARAAMFTVLEVLSTAIKASAPGTQKAESLAGRSGELRKMARIGVNPSLKMFASRKASGGRT